MGGSRDKKSGKKRTVPAKKDVVKGKGTETPPEPPVSPTREILELPIVSPRDANHYKIIKLENGLTAILVSTCGYGTELAIEQVAKEEAEERICEDRPDTSVFNRRRGRRNIPVEEDETKPPRASSKSKTTPKCTNTEDIDKFDKDQSVFQRGLVGSMIDEMLGKDPEESKKPEEEEEKLWLPEEESDIKILSKACRIVLEKNPDVEFALNIAAGSMSDPTNIPGCSVIARNYLAGLFSEGNKMSCTTHLFNHSEHSTLNFITKYENIEKKLEYIGEKILNNKVNLKNEFVQEIDGLDEYQEKIQCRQCWENPLSDWRRLTLLLSFAKEEHPLRNISPGSPLKIYGLTDNGTNELEGNIEGYIEQHYVGENITFAIKAPQTLDIMDSWVTNSLSQIPKGGKKKHVDAPDPFDTDTFKMFYRVYSSSPHCCDKGNSHIIITFALPPEFGLDYRVKALDYYSDLISNDGPGGLCAYLKQKNLGVEVKTGCDCEDSGVQRNKYTSLLEIQITLGEEGTKQINEVIEAVFSYIKFLRTSGPFREFYEEMKKNRSVIFHAIDQEVNFNEPYPMHVSKLSRWLHYYPSKEVIVAPFLILSYDEEVIRHVDKFLLPENANYMLCICIDDDEFEEPPEKEPIFQTAYKASNVTEEQLQKWQSVEPYPEFKVPGSNPFLPELDAQFCLVKVESKVNQKEKINSYFKNFVPCDVKLFINEESPYKIWYQQDDENNHFVSYNVHIVSPVSYSAPHHCIMVSLWWVMVNDILAPDLHSATKAQIEYSIKPTHYGIIITVSSWNHKLTKVLDVILEQIALFGSKLEEDGFNKMKNSLLKHIGADVTHESMSNHNIATDVYKTLTQGNRWTLIELHTELKNIELVDLTNFLNEFKETCNFVALVRGNIIEDNAKELSETIETNFPSGGRSPTPIHSFKRRLHQLPLGERGAKFQTFGNNSTENNVFTYYQIAHNSTKSNVIAEIVHDNLKNYIEVICKIMNEENKNKKIPKGNGNKKMSQDSIPSNSFDMSSSLHEHQGVMTLCIESNGSIPFYDVNTMRKNIEVILNNFGSDVLCQLSPKDLNCIKNDIKNTYLSSEDEKCCGGGGSNQLIGHLNNMYKSLRDLTFRWTQNFCKAEAIGGISLEDVQNWYMTNIHSKGTECHRLSVLILGNEPTTQSKPTIPKETILELRDRRKSIRNCGYNDQHTPLTHSHKPTDKNESFRLHLLSDSKEEGIGRCEDDFYIMDINEFKLHLYKYPVSLDV